MIVIKTWATFVMLSLSCDIPGSVVFSPTFHISVFYYSRLLVCVFGCSHFFYSHMVGTMFSVKVLIKFCYTNV